MCSFIRKQIRNKQFESFLTSPYACIILPLLKYRAFLSLPKDSWCLFLIIVEETTCLSFLPPCGVFLECPINGIYAVRSVLSLDCLCSAQCFKGSGILLASQLFGQSLCCSIIWQPYQSQFLFPVDRHLDCFQFGALMNSPSVNTVVTVFLRSVPRITGLQGRCMFKFIRKYQPDFQSGCYCFIQPPVT